MTNRRESNGIRHDRSPEERERLIESALPMIDQIAKALGGSREDRVEELIAIGRLEAVEAERMFDATRGVSFEAYVRPAVRGAMHDALRGERANDVSFDEPASSRPPAGAVRISRTPEEVVARVGARTRAFEALAEASAELPPEEQAMLQRYYVDGEALNDIAASMGVSHPTAKRWHQRALAWLRARLLRDGITDPIPSSRCA